MANPAQDGADTGPLSSGTLLQNRYLIQKLIGGGGMGVVYLAQDQRLANRPCALKEMVDHFIDPQQRREANDYFAREADTLAQLRHSAIPAISDRFDHANRHYLVMEYVEGRNLEEEMAALGHPLDEGLAIDITRQLCEVLSYLHNFTPPIVYRDMKPSNVMLTPKGKVMLIDFGIARLFKVASKGTMIGTLGFAPPEQYQGQVDPRSDIYSLGATLHYVLTGRDPEKFPPFSFPPVRTLRADLSPNFAGAIDRALSYNADGRPQTVSEFRDMMLYGTGLTTAPISVSPKSGTADLSHVTVVAPPTRKRRSGLRRAMGFLIFTLFLGSLAFGATYIYSNPELQTQLGIKALIDGLPWKHQELVDKAREHPLEFQRVTLQLSTREGSPLSAPKARFLNTELSNNHYLAWVASFKNGLAGLEGRSQKVVAKFFDPNGLQIASSDSSRFIGPALKQVDFSGVALIPSLSDRPLGNYKVELFSGDQQLAAQQFSVDEDVTSKLKEKAEKEAEAVRERAAEEARKDAAEKLAKIEEFRRRPLQLLSIQFQNTTKSGTPISGSTQTFDAAKVLFVGWQISFKNRLYGLDMNQYRVDAAYIAPDGHTLGSVDDVRMISDKARSAVFSGRIGNSSGNAFLPGVYAVNFYLNGQYLAQRRFRVVSTTASLNPGIGLPPPSSSTTTTSPSSGMSAALPSLDSPTVASGSIDGLAGKDNVPMEIRLRPQPNGFLHGELVIHEAGYGLTPIDGFIRGSHIEFQVPYGSRVLYFEGQRRREQMSGSFQSEPAGERGNWSARVD
jgi:serine/threonine protein kinase